MKAYVLNGIGQLDFCEVPMPVLKEDEVLVEVRAAGICGSDIPRIYETGTYHFPTIPGHEFSGVVREVKQKRYSHLIGKRVGVFPLIPCMKCIPCHNRQYEMCEHYDYLGSRRDGGFAEFVAVPARNLLVLPDEVSFESAAMLEPACVGIHALKQINRKDIRSAAIIGAGTIGMLIAQWLRTTDATEIYLVGTKEAQKQLAHKIGISSFYNNHTEDVIQRIMDKTDGQGCDLVIECSGYANVLAQCIQLAKRGGNLCIVGNPHSSMKMPQEVYWQILRKQLKICGTWNSSFIP